MPRIYKGIYSTYKGNFCGFQLLHYNKSEYHSIRTYGNTPTIVMQFEKADLGIFKSAIEYIN